jgi:hypothetical protein
LPSLFENNMIFMNVWKMMPVMALAYTWNKDERNPLAWPYFATVGGRSSSLGSILESKGA